MGRNDGCEFLERYLWEAEAHANELLQFLGLEERIALLETLPKA